MCEKEMNAPAALKFLCVAYVCYAAAQKGAARAHFAAALSISGNLHAGAKSAGEKK